MAQEFYGGNPSDVSDTVKKYSETGEFPKDHMSGVLCEFAGLVSVGNSIRSYGGGTNVGGTSASGARTPEH